MNIKEFATNLKNEVEELKRAGYQTINCDDLILHLNRVISDQSSVSSVLDHERFKTDLQLIVERSKSAYSAQLELFKSVIDAGQNAIKSAFLLSGGASVALLAFIGRIAEIDKSKISDFADALTIFVFSTLIVVMVSGITYLSQWFYAGDTHWKKNLGFGLNILAIIAGFLAYFVFLWGMIKSNIAFVRFSCF